MNFNLKQLELKWHARFCLCSLCTVSCQLYIVKRYWALVTVSIFVFFPHKASVHLPRIGHSTRGFNWYGTERLIRKHLASRGIPTFMYHFKVFHRWNLKKWYFSESIYLKVGVIFPSLGGQILSQQNGKEHGAPSDIPLCGLDVSILPRATVTEHKQVDGRDRNRKPRPLRSSPGPRRARQFHEGSPCVFLQPACIREEEAGPLPHHISFQSGRLYHRIVLFNYNYFVAHSLCQIMYFFNFKTSLQACWNIKSSNYQQVWKGVISACVLTVCMNVCGHVRGSSEKHKTSKGKYRSLIITPHVKMSPLLSCSALTMEMKRRSWVQRSHT